MRILVTGSSGLIGSEAVEYYDGLGHEVHGIDNNMRREFFGPGGDTTWNLDRLRKSTKRFTHHTVDIRDADALEKVFKAHRFEAIIHCAAQPSHDKAKDIPLVDFGVNATGTVNVLEMYRRHCPEAPFCHMSTNKVYGDAPNELPLKELPTRWEYADPADYKRLHAEFVPRSDRWRFWSYRGFYLCIRTRDIAAHCELVADAPLDERTQRRLERARSRAAAR